VVSLQLSSVHWLESSQLRAEPPSQKPVELQASLTVQNWPSSQAAPTLGVRRQLLAAVSHVSVVQGFPSLHWSLLVQAVNTTQSAGFELTDDELNEQASTSVADAAPKSFRSMEQVATVSSGNASPAGKGSSGCCDTVHVVFRPEPGWQTPSPGHESVQDAPGVVPPTQVFPESCEGPVHRSGLASEQVKSLTAERWAGAPPSAIVTQTARFALPSPSVSYSEHASAVLPPGRRTISQSH
jgi:hypothetical protein